MFVCSLSGGAVGSRKPAWGEARSGEVHMALESLEARQLLSVSSMDLDSIPGDSNHDGRFDRQDIVLVLQAGKYLTGMPATFEEGDWNSDGVFDQADIVVALKATDVVESIDRVDGPSVKYGGSLDVATVIDDVARARDSSRADGTPNRTVGQPVAVLAFDTSEIIDRDPGGSAASGISAAVDTGLFSVVDRDIDPVTGLPAPFAAQANLGIAEEPVDDQDPAAPSLPEPISTAHNFESNSDVSSRVGDGRVSATIGGNQTGLYFVDGVSGEVKLKTDGIVLNASGTDSSPSTVHQCDRANPATSGPACNPGLLASPIADSADLVFANLKPSGFDGRA